MTLCLLEVINSKYFFASELVNCRYKKIARQKENPITAKSQKVKPMNIAKKR